MEETSVHVEVAHINVSKSNDNTASRGERQSKIFITAKGTLRVCTDDQLETAHLKLLRMIRRQQTVRTEYNSTGNLAAVQQLPFVQRYIVLEVQTSINNTDEEATISQEEIMAKLKGGEISCDQATIHAYSSYQDYVRHCNSARKKSRIRVDRVLGQDIVIQACFQDQLEDVDFCVQSVAGVRVIASWYFRASTKEVKRAWMNILEYVK